MKKIMLLFIVLCLCLIISCVSTPPQSLEPGDSDDSDSSELESEEETPPLERKNYFGHGEAEGLTFLDARNKAIMDAVRKAVIDLIGAEKEQAHRDTLKDVLYNRDPNSLIYKETIDNIRKEMLSDEKWMYECTVDVNLKAILIILEASGILGDETAEPTEPEPEQETTPTEYYEEITDEEAAFIANYVNKLLYMVYFSEEIEENIVYIKAAIGKANEYLTKNGMDTIDYNQIESLKEDQRMVYEEETGESQTIIQWIANKLNADIYIEIFAITDSYSQMGGKHYGTAQVELKAFETSTGILMGSASYNTLDPAFSTVSQEQARLNAIQGAVYQSMPRLIEQVKENMKKMLYRGIRYEIIIQNPVGDRIMSRFWEKLGNKVKDIKSLSESSEEVRYYVWYIGSLNDIKNLIYDITEAIAGLENLEMILSRGKSITFNTGY